MADIFISYAHEDAPRARAIERALEGAGAEVWSDDELTPGDDWLDQVEDRLNKSNVIVMLITPSFLESRWSQLEMGYAIARSRREGVTLVPILFEDAELPRFLSSFKAIDARHLSQEELTEKMLAAAAVAT